MYSRADEQKVVQDVWPESWVLPFRIFPLGTPNKQLSKEKAKDLLPVFTTTKETNFGKIFHVQAVTVFSPTQIGSEDWEILIRTLVD